MPKRDHCASPKRPACPWLAIAVAPLLIFAADLAGAAEAADDPPYTLAKEGFFYVGGRPVTIDGHTHIAGQMYVDVRIPAKATHRFPIVMVHGGTRSGTTYLGTPDGREGWAQYFVRQGYAVYVVDQPGRGRSGYLAESYGAWKVADGEGGQRRYLAQEKYRLWPQAHLHTQWPGSGTPDDPVTLQMISGYLPEIADFTKQQFLNRDALVALLDKIGPAILMVHSQAGAFAWPVADARPDRVKAILAIEPNGPPFYEVQFIGAPDYFKQGRLALPYGLSAVPLTYSPAVADAKALAIVQQDQSDAPDLVRCHLQKEPARKLPNLTMPILVLTSEASYHAPYDHCTVKYLRQAGAQPTFLRLADLGIKGNSHVMMNEKNNKEIAAVIARWLDKALPEKQ
ncbi:MAG TPA: alpha/beta hydrolase [Xanthobacteraceae bacterium]|jgi:pimeloyl-ACP methyl ester carboxylesterase